LKMSINPKENSSMSADKYTHGHHESVLRSHTWRTAENSAGYLLASLKAGQDLLDVGCGPGTITLDLAYRVAPGQVVGIDRESGVIARAEALRKSRGVANVTFSIGDVYALEFGEASFDVVHAHQVLQHLTKPVAALKEMYRVLRPGGILGVRDGDYATFAIAPADAHLVRWLDLYHQITRRNGAEADAGRYLLGWVQTAGFADVTATSSTWTFADPESRAWWGAIWADRVRLSSFADQALAYELATSDELDSLADAWTQWADKPDGFFAAMSVEVTARRPPLPS
jgi:ubiquinone/menaquinone biosynthesis C-methylase UbiE